MDNQTIQSVIDMELESPYSQGLGDHDERFRVPTPPITESICNQPLPLLPLIQANNESTIITSDNNIIQPTQNEIPLVEPTVLTNVDITESSSKEVNDTMDDDQSKQIIVPNLSIEIENHSNRSRDEFVKLLSKEAFTSKSPSPIQIVVNSSRQSGDDENNESNSDTKVLSTRTRTVISNNHQDNLIITATNIDQPEAQEEEEEPTVKRIKVDLIAPLPPNEGLFCRILSTISILLFVLEIKSLITPSDDHDYRQDLDERRRQQETLHSRSRSQSTSSHKSSTKESKTKSPSSHRSSSTNHRYGQQRRYEHNRSYNYQQRNNPNSTPIRHQRFNYNHQSVADHPRFAHVDIIPSPKKNINYNSFSTPNYSQNQK
jgi:hypothetical protein